MFPNLSYRRSVTVVTAFTCLFFTTSTLADLSFENALHDVLQNSPSLKASQTSIVAAQQAAIPAGELPDPRLSLSINNLPVEGDDRFSLVEDFMTMREVELMQAFPNRAKRAARNERAKGNIALKGAELHIHQIQLLRLTAMAWLTLHNLQQQSNVLEKLDKENQLLVSAIESQHAGKHGMTGDVLVPRQVEALLDEKRDDIRLQQAVALAELQRSLGDTARQPLTGKKPHWDIRVDTLLKYLPDNPELTIYEPMEKLIDAQIKEARANKIPDWEGGVAYAHRGQAFSDMVSLKLTMDLPLFGSSRQTPLIAAKLAERDQFYAEREYRTRELRAALESEYAFYEQQEQRLKRQQEVFLPLAEKRVALLQAAWQSNRVPLLEVIHARREYLEAELKQVELEGQRDRAAAQLYFTYGLRKADLQHPETLSFTGAAP